jgi:hypothetical protein
MVPDTTANSPHQAAKLKVLPCCRALEEELQIQKPRWNQKVASAPLIQKLARDRAAK